MNTNIFPRAGAVVAVWFLLGGALGCTADFMSKEKTPKIANLNYIPLIAPAEEGKTTPMIGTFDIIHKSGETASVNVAAYDAGGKELSSGSIPLNEASLKASDTLGFGFDMSTAKNGDYTFQVSITDAQGRQSNKLEGTFRVTGIY